MAKILTVEGLTDEQKADLVRKLLGEWTTTPPVVEGWYWVCKVGGVPVIREYTEVTHDIYQPGVYWLGPLPVPAAPKG